MLKTLGAQVKEFKKASIATPIFMILEVIMEMIIPLMMASIIDNGVEKGDLHHIYVVGAFMVVAAAIGLFAGIMGGKYGAKASAGFAKNLRQAMFENIQEYSFSNIDKFSTAGLVTRLTTDVTNLQNAYQMILRMCMRAPASMIIAMIMSFYINARLASIYLVAVILLGTCLFLIMRSATKYFEQAFPKYDELNASVQENVSAIRVVKAYVREDYETGKFHKASENIYKIFCKAEENLSFNAPLMQLTVYSCILLISWLGAKMIVGSSLSTGELMSLLTYCMNILMSLMMLSMVFVMITMSLASARRISEVLNEKSDLDNPENPDFSIPDGSITFDHVYFNYKKGAGEPVLSDINLSIQSGETIGIIGGTGSAKTSLVNLISRLYDVTDGSVKVGGKDVRSYDMETLRNEVAVVLQKNVLFSGTILDNIAYGLEHVTEKEVMEVIKDVGLEDMIEKLPDGIYTQLGEHGDKLSGGQRQRISIARALIRKPKIIVFDEATSALDSASEKKVQEATSNMMKNCTTFLVAHRLSTIRNADRIVAMRDGKIVEVGSYDELMEKKGYFYELKALQS